MKKIYFAEEKAREDWIAEQKDKDSHFVVVGTGRFRLNDTGQRIHYVDTVGRGMKVKDSLRNEVMALTRMVNGHEDRISTLEAALKEKH